MALGLAGGGLEDRARPGAALGPDVLEVHGHGSLYIKRENGLGIGVWARGGNFRGGGIEVSGGIGAGVQVGT